MKREYVNPEVEIITYTADTQIMVSAADTTQTSKDFGKITYGSLN